MTGTGIATLAQALEQIEQIKTQQSRLNELGTQLATGKKAQRFSGLEVDVVTSKRARADFAALKTYRNNIQHAEIRLNRNLVTIEEFQQQARNLADAIVEFSQQSAHQKGEEVLYDDPLTPEIEQTLVGYTSSEPDVDLQTLIDLANIVFDLAGELLNAKDGDRFVFAGAESLVKPFENDGRLDSAISGLVTRWKNGTITTSSLIADINDRTAFAGNPDALSDSLVGFSAPLSSRSTQNVFVRIDDTKEVDVTTLANDSGFRDIIVAAAFLRNGDLPPIADTYENGVYPGIPDVQGAPGNTVEEQKANFFALLNNFAEKVTSAIDDLDALRFKLENVRIQLNESDEQHRNDQAFLENVIADVEDVDVNEVAVVINRLQINLAASYSATATLQRLSILNFLQ